MREQLIEMMRITQEAKIAALENGIPATYKKQKALLEILEQACLIVITYDYEWE